MSQVATTPQGAKRIALIPLVTEAVRNRLYDGTVIVKQRAAWLWLEVDGKKTPCHVLTEGRVVGRGGHRQFHIDGVFVLAHRLAYAIHYGREPAGELLRHLCDNPFCINPIHLREGSYQDNANDRRSAKAMRASGQRTTRRCSSVKA